MTEVNVNVAIHRSTDGMYADGARLSEQTICRSEVLQTLNASCYGSTQLPMDSREFEVWLHYTPGGTPLAVSDLRAVLQVRPPKASCSRQSQGWHLPVQEYVRYNIIRYITGTLRKCGGMGTFCIFQRHKKQTSLLTNIPKQSNM